MAKKNVNIFSRTFSENSKHSSYNPLSKKFISSDSSYSESLNSYSQLEFKYDYHFFTQELSTFHCLSFLSDGNKILPPTELQMIPYFIK